MNIIFKTLLPILILSIMPIRNTHGQESPNDKAQKPLFRFGIIADVQYCPSEPEGTRYYRNSLPKLREALSSFKTDSAEFIVNLGDIIDRDYSSFGTVLDIIDSSAIRTYHLTGNHDYEVNPRLRKHLPLRMPSKEGYYTFSEKNFRFIVLNGNELSTYGPGNKSVVRKTQDYLDALKKEGNINAIEWNGGISVRQFQWLMIQLDKAAADNEKVIIFCHFPVYPENIHNLLNYKEVLSVLNNYSNIVAWFNGHNHAGNYGNTNMIHFLTMKGMVETENTNSFALVEVYSNRIWIKGYGREKSQILAY
ncbi:MAG: phosphatase [Bacteroidales bacterium]|nr:phosphatase [Bacteroidales bacterium]